VVVFFLLLVCLMPRYPREGRATFPINRNAEPEDYRVPDSEDDTTAQQQTLCMLLCNILYWKTFCLRISFTIYIGGTILVAVMLAYNWL
jgi:hypothetical protein